MDKVQRLQAFSKLIRDETLSLIEASTVNLDKFDKILESFLDVALEGYKPKEVTGAEILRRHTRPDND